MRLLLLLAVASTPVWACSCGERPSAKEAWLESPLVFVGRIEGTDPNITREQDIAPEQAAWVRVTEPFKGVKQDQVFELHTRGGCSGSFLQGSELLLYLFPDEKPGVWMARACHRSRVSSEAADDLTFLRELPGSARGNRVSGAVQLWEDDPVDRSRQARGLTGVRVRAIGGSNSYETFTGAGGSYEFRNLEPGTYTIQAEYPRETTLRFAIAYGKNSPERSAARNGDTKLTVTEESSNGFEFYLAPPDSRITGRVLDPGGRPMKGVCIDVEPALGTPAVRTLSGCTEADGSYLLNRLSPGTYRIVANRHGEMSASAPFGRLYYPGTSDIDKAGTVTVAAGRHVDGIDFRVSELARRIELRGRLTFSDGVPLPNQMVKFQGDGERYFEYGWADAEGTFVMRTLEGRPGKLTAEFLFAPEDLAACPQFRAKVAPNGFLTLAPATPYPVAGDKSLSGIHMLFPHPSCKAWLERDARLHER